MTASTEAFLALQRLYRERMEADAAAVETRASALLKKLGRDPAPLRRGAVRQFVKNARNLRCGLVHGTSVVWRAATADAGLCFLQLITSCKPATFGSLLCGFWLCSTTRGLFPCPVILSLYCIALHQKHLSKHLHRYTWGVILRTLS